MAATDYRTSRLGAASAQGGRRGSSVVMSFGLAAAINLLLVAIVSAWLSPPGSVGPVMAAVAVFGIAAAVAGVGLVRRYPHPDVGLCNIVTLLRLALATTLAAPLLASPDESWTAWPVFAVALTAFALDGVDGRLARRSGRSSDFGARFDIEVDALFAALLALLALQSGKAGVWVLALGFMRYAFVAAGAAAPWLRAEMPERWRRKAVCVAQIGVLVALLAPVVTPPLSQSIAAVATALLVWSFAVDVAWLRRERE